MSKTITRAANAKRARKMKRAAVKAAAVRESRVILFGQKSDIEVQESMRRAAIAGRQVEVVARPGFDSGIGPCGKHVCSCKDICKAEYERGAYQGDQGATMGFSF